MACSSRYVANGYQSDVVAYDPFPNAKIATYVDYKDTIEEAVEGADIVTLHVPATKYNHYLFNAELFKHFKRAQYLSIVREVL